VLPYLPEADRSWVIRRIVVERSRARWYLERPCDESVKIQALLWNLLDASAECDGAKYLQLAAQLAEMESPDAPRGYVTISHLRRRAAFEAQRGCHVAALALVDEAERELELQLLASDPQNIFERAAMSETALEAGAFGRCAALLKAAMTDVTKWQGASHEGTAQCAVAHVAWCLVACAALLERVGDYPTAGQWYAAAKCHVDKNAAHLRTQVIEFNIAVGHLRCGLDASSIVDRLRRGGTFTPATFCRLDVLTAVRSKDYERVLEIASKAKEAASASPVEGEPKWAPECLAWIGHAKVKLGRYEEGAADLSAALDDAQYRAYEGETIGHLEALILAESRLGPAAKSNSSMRLKAAKERQSQRRAELSAAWRDMPDIAVLAK
jgi:tetratricopeptide (TPR) repeat protein